MYTIQEEEYKGQVIKIHLDENPENPREWDNFGHMVCFHGRYDLGDKTDLTSDMFEGWEELREHLINKEGAIIIAPLYLYDHSGLRLKIGSFYGCGLPQGHARFDSGQVGFIYLTKEDIQRNFGVKNITKRIKERAMKVLEGEVNTYDDYLSGQVYGFVAENKEGEHIDSCWGFFGDTDDMIKKAQRSIDYYIKEAIKKHNKKVKAQIKHKVNLDKREPLTI